MTKTEITPEAVIAALGQVIDPVLGGDLVSTDSVSDVDVNGSKVSLTLKLITPAHPQKENIVEAARQAVLGLDGIERVEVEARAVVPTDGRPRSKGSSDIRNVIAIASGKGGVGKSTVAVNVAVALAQYGAKVGLLDADVYGPNIPLMMGVDQLPAPPTAAGTLVPAEAHGVKLMSIGFLVKREQPMIWRGPMLHSAVRQFTEDVTWGELDYLIIDLPPGTGDVQLSLAQTSSVTGGVIVTLPQQVSVEDARRGLEMFRQLEIPLIGVVENMSYLELPDGQKMDVFGSGGGERMAAEAGVEFIGIIPMDPLVRQGGDNGEPIVVAQPESKVALALRQIANQVAVRAALLALEQQSKSISIRIN